MAPQDVWDALTEWRDRIRDADTTNETEDSMSAPRVERKVTAIQGSETHGDYYTFKESVHVTLYLMSDGTVRWQEPTIDQEEETA